jgi:pyruvate/2-oxoglutarate dehydrogenase complex dihydrolipoamide dehydrogenase (E3) component
MLAHKAVHEAHVAAEVIAGELLGDAKLSQSAFDARVIPSVAYTDPEIAWVGLTEDDAKSRGIKVKRGLFPWSASGRAIANGRDEGFTKLLFDDSDEAHSHGRIHRCAAILQHGNADIAGQMLGGHHHTIGPPNRLGRSSQGCQRRAKGKSQNTDDQLAYFFHFIAP